ncbi:MAG: SMC-Scp complex subunit ScpB [Phycisphaerae bacterium]|nr:SMC-Scp complex subunit ScpB [Phycisphaerae bacterium]
MPEDDLTSRIEAILMTADRPIGERKLASILGIVTTGQSDSEEEETASDAAGPVQQIRDAVDELNSAYESTDRSFRIERVAGGLQMLTLPRFAEDIARLKGVRNQSRLSQAALETLAIIAYRQPILRADLESIRGVACGEVLRGLMERRLVRIAGRAEELGRPMLYGTTREFLEVFGLATLEDLPQAKELRPAVERTSKSKSASEPAAEEDSSGPSEESDPEPALETEQTADDAG